MRTYDIRRGQIKPKRLMPRNIQTGRNLRGMIEPKMLSEITDEEVSQLLHHHILLELNRRYLKSSYTIGRLLINKKWYCDTLEDKDRGLRKNMSLEEIKKKKKWGQTAIPTGTYDVTLSNYGKWKPCIMSVPGFADGYVKIHAGNTDSDSNGCILVGYNSAPGRLAGASDPNGYPSSTQTYQKLVQVLEKASSIKIIIRYHL